MIRKLAAIGLSALLLVACSAEETTPSKEKQEVVNDVETVKLDESKPQEQVTKVTNNFDKTAFLENLNNDLNLNYGDAGGTETPMEWYKYITKLDVNYDTKTLYAYTNIETFDDYISFDITNAMINTVNFHNEKYFHVEKFVVINSKGKETFVRDNIK